MGSKICSLHSPFGRSCGDQPISMSRTHKGFVDVVVAGSQNVVLPHLSVYFSKRSLQLSRSFRVLAFPIRFLLGLFATQFVVFFFHPPSRGTDSLWPRTLHDDSSRLAIFSVWRRRACSTISRVSSKSARRSSSSLRLRRFSSWCLAFSSRWDQATRFHSSADSRSSCRLYSRFLVERRDTFLYLAISGTSRSV